MFEETTVEIETRSIYDTIHVAAEVAADKLRSGVNCVSHDDIHLVGIVLKTLAAFTEQDATALGYVFTRNLITDCRQIVDYVVKTVFDKATNTEIQFLNDDDEF